MASKWKKVVAVFDVHVPHNINMSPVNSFLKDFKPTHFVIGGDFLNLGFISHWREKDFAEIGFMTIRQNLQLEFERGRKLLAEWSKILPENCLKYYIPGNHEWWLVGFLQEHPDVLSRVRMKRPTIQTDYELEKRKFLGKLLKHYLNLEETGYTVLPFGGKLKIGKIYFIHGHELGGQLPAKKAAVDYKRNVVFGHHHTNQIYTSTSPLDSKDCHSGVSVPCLTHLAPGYLRTQTTRWLNGFYVATIDPKGFYWDSILKIINKKIITPDGKVYK